MIEQLAAAGGGASYFDRLVKASSVFEHPVDGFADEFFRPPANASCELPETGFL